MYSMRFVFISTLLIISFDYVCGNQPKFYIWQPAKQLKCQHFELPSNFYITGKHPDPKLKEGVIRWIKDNIDPILVEKWYSMRYTEKVCVKNSLEYLMYDIQIEDIFYIQSDKAKYKLDNCVYYFCPAAWKNVDQIYERIMKYSVAILFWYKTLPKTVRKSFEGIGKILSSKNIYEQQKDHILKNIEQIFNLSKKELLSLEMTHPLLATFLTGKLQNESLNVINNLKQYSLGEKPVNISIGRLLLLAKNELIHYFDTQHHASKTNNTTPNNIPINLEQKFIRDLNYAYDELYYIYDSTFGVYEIAAIVDDIEQNRPSSSNINRLGSYVYLIFGLVVFNF